MIDDRTTLSVVIIEEEQAIANIPSIEEYTEKHWDLLDELFFKIEKVTDLGGAEEDIKNIDALNKGKVKDK